LSSCPTGVKQTEGEAENSPPSNIKPLKLNGMALSNEQNFIFYFIHFSINNLQYIWKDIVKMGIREIRWGI
jgi:hypothetical protein